MQYQPLVFRIIEALVSFIRTILYFVCTLIQLGGFFYLPHDTIKNIVNDFILFRFGTLFSFSVSFLLFYLRKPQKFSLTHHTKR